MVKLSKCSMALSLHRFRFVLPLQAAKFAINDSEFKQTCVIQPRIYFSKLQSKHVEYGAHIFDQCNLLGFTTNFVPDIEFLNAFEANFDLILWNVHSEQVLYQCCDKKQFNNCLLWAQ